MTLIITLLTRSVVIQASDRRLTLPGGQVYDDHSNKALCGQCADSFFTVAYTGLAVLGPLLRRTDRWLVEQLSDIKAPLLPTPEVGVLLSARAQDALINTPVRPQSKGLTFLFAGFTADGRPFCMSVTNQEDKNGSPLRSQGAAMQAHVRVGDHHRMPEHFFAASVIGEERAYGSRILKSLSRLGTLQAFTAGPTDSITQALVTLIRYSGTHPVYGRYVGQECLTVIVPPDGQTEAKEYSTGTLPIAHMPHMVGRSGTMMDVMIRTGDDFTKDVPPFETWPLLDAEITYDSQGHMFQVTNRSSQAWTDVRLDLNGGPNDWTDIPKGWFGSSGFVYSMPSLNAGQILRLGAMAFVRRSGACEEFDPRRNRPAILVLTARLPTGASGRFTRHWP